MSISSPFNGEHWCSSNYFGEEKPVYNHKLKYISTNGIAVEDKPKNDSVSEDQFGKGFKAGFNKGIEEGSKRGMDLVWTYLEIKHVAMLPPIDEIIINPPAVVVKWNDDTKTVGKAMPANDEENLPGDEFDPEIGFAMAIARKYFECAGFENPRAAFKNILSDAKDFSDK